MIKKLALTLLPLARTARFGTLKNRVVQMPVFSQKKYFVDDLAISQLKSKLLKETRIRSKLKIKIRKSKTPMVLQKRKQRQRRNYPR